MQWLRTYYDRLKKDDTSAGLRVVAVILISLPFVLLVLLVGMFAVNVPFWDQWELVPLLQEYHVGTLSFADFFAQHNEHRLLFPRLIMIVLAVSTHWNTVLECFVSIVLAGIGFVCLYQLLRPVFRTRWLLWLVALLVSVIVFSPLQLENWLWGWQLQWYLTTGGLIIAVWALHTWQAARFWKVSVAAAGATIATFSLASGFMVWLVCVPLFVLQKRLRPWTAVWVVLAAGAIAAYFIGYQDPAYQPSKSLFLHEPVQFVTYVLMYIGRPLTPVVSLAVPIGIGLFVLAAGCLWLAYKRMRPALFGALLPWVCLAAYSVLAALSTAVSRLGYGMEQAFSGRYATLSQFFLLGCVVVLAALGEWWLRSTARNRGVMLRGVGAAAAVIVLLTGINYTMGALQMKVRHDNLVRTAQCLRTATQTTDPCLLQAYPNQAIVWERLQYLRAMHYGGL